MRLLFGSFLTFAVAACVGLGATWFAITRGTAFGPITLGPWQAWPRMGTIEIDPYARAIIARSGELPIGSGDGVAFYARTDSTGQPLDGRCDTIVEGLTPPARYWTVTLYDTDGKLVPNSLGRHGFTSQEILRQATGSFALQVAPRVRSGNWLPTGGIERYLLVLRLYDTSVGVATRAGREAPMPEIGKKVCP